MKRKRNVERDSVTFVWTIENLNVGWKGVIKSPAFLSSSLDNTEWKMNLNPLADDDSYISLDLTRCGSEDNGTQIITADCNLSIVDNKGSTLKWMETENRGFRRGHSWLCQHFVKRSEVFVSRKIDYLPLDTLTVICRLWRKLNAEAEIRFSRTRIEKISFVWRINNFCHLKPQQRKSLHVKTVDSKTQFLTFEYVVEKNGEVEIDVSSTKYQRLHFVCYVSLIDSFGRVSKCQSFWYSFESRRKVWSPKIWRFLSFLNKGFLCSNKTLYLPMGILSMQVECFFWTGDADSNNDNQIQSFQVVDEIKIDNVQYNYESGCRFMHDMQCMYEEGILSDLILRAGGKEFPVHKSLLSARSPVFRAMFTTEVKEDAEIPDVDADTLQRMLLFVYFNRMEENMHWESAMNLYFAADKFAIDELKRASCSILRAGLCASNACEILVHSDFHEDQDLKSTTKDFIIVNHSKIIGSEDWNKMLKNHIHLTVDIFSELYLTKMKK